MNLNVSYGSCRLVRRIVGESIKKLPLTGVVYDAFRHLNDPLGYTVF